MPSFGSTSRSRLVTCHPDLQKVFNEVIKHFDCSILHGHRTPEEQAGLYAIGRTVQLDRKPVTTKDGYNKLSMHNHWPSLAVDAVPYHRGLDFNDIDNIRYFSGFVMGVAASMGIDLRWGGDWDNDTETSDNVFEDLLHFELIGAK